MEVPGATVAPLATTIAPLTAPLPLSVWPLARLYGVLDTPETSRVALLVIFGLLLMLPLPVNARVPALIVVSPLYVFTPPRTQVPAPDLMRAVLFATLLFTIAPPKVFAA